MRLHLTQRTASLAPLVALAVLFVIVAVVAASTVRHEITFYDEGVYVVTAKAIATGAGYRNMNLPDSPPQSKYPPVVPALLAAGWKIWPAFPENLALMKTSMIGVGLCFLLVSYLYMSAGWLTSWQAVAAVTLIGFHPLFLEYTTELTSEIPYALVSVTSLYCYRRFLVRGSNAWLAASATLCAAAFLTRSVGVAVAIAIAIDAIRRNRRDVIAALAVAGTLFVFPWFAWSWSAQDYYTSYPPEIAANYRGYVVDLLSRDWAMHIWQALPLNTLVFTFSWASWFMPWLPYTAGIFVVLFLLRPIVARVRQETRVHDWYCAATSAMILLWPWPANDRFVLVLSPFVVAYFVDSLDSLVHLSPARSLARLKPVALAVTLVTAVGYDTTRIVARRRAEPSLASVYDGFHATADWIRTNTESDAIVLAADDPPYYLFANRKTIRLSYPNPFSVYYRPVDHPAFDDPHTMLEWLRTMHACYIVRDPLIGTAETKYNVGLIESLRQEPGHWMRRVYSTDDRRFELFKLDSCGKSSH